MAKSHPRVPLLNFEGGPGVRLLNFEVGPRVPLLNHRGGSLVPLLNLLWGSSRVLGPKVLGPGVVVTLLCHASLMN